MIGRIFSIEEFSVFDGDGVRETVFLKGCPLRCNWCHSPEGQIYDVQLVRSPNGCLGCGKCLDAGEKAGVYTVDMPISAIRRYRNSEVHGDAYRRPEMYGLLTEDMKRSPFLRADFRK